MSNRRILLKCLGVASLILLASIVACERRAARGLDAADRVSPTEPKRTSSVALPTPPPLGHYAHPPEAPPVPVETIPVPPYPGARLISEDQNDQVGWGRTYLVDATREEVVRFYARELPARGWIHVPISSEVGPGFEPPNYDRYDIFYEKSLQYFRPDMQLSSEGGETRVDISLQHVGTM